MSAKIYSDIRDNLCPCGGEYTNKEVIKNYDVPLCSKCNKHPHLLRIIANIIDLNGNRKRVAIRYSQDGERLVDAIDCLSTLRRIKQEIAEGSFDVRRYYSRACNDSFLFQNVCDDYLEFHKKRLKRGEITPAGFKDKKLSIQNHLLQYFKNMDVSTITSAKILRYKNSYEKNLRQRDKALSELKSLLKYAYSMDLITKVPHFDKIPASKRRRSTIDVKTAEKIINAIEHPLYQDMFSLMRIYPVRPSTLRALKWRDIDFKNDMIKFGQHFSLNEEIKGRKSIKEDHEKAVLKYPLTDEARSILNRQLRSINNEDYVFKGKLGQQVGANVLPRWWNKAVKKLGLPNTESYELKHARLSEIAELSKGNLTKLLQASPHTSLKTLLERYVKTDVDISDIFY